MKDRTSANLGSRLANARQATGMSTRRIEVELAKHGHVVTHATIANYERGRSKPSLPLLAAFAEVYQRPINWFLQSGAVLSNIEYRSLKSVRQGERRQFNAHAQRWLEAYRNLERRLAQPLENRLHDFRVNPDQSGQELAHALRERLGLEDHQPIESVVAVLEGFGIRVVEIHSDARIDALAGLLDDEKVVVLNAGLCNDRVRLNAGHELGHHHYEDCVGSSNLTKQEIEKRAFEFGSHFLLPESQLEEAFQDKSIIRLVDFKEKYGISLAGMIYRAKESEILSQRTYERLWVQFSKHGWRKQEPGSVRADRPRRFERMLEAAIEEKKLTWQKAEEVTGIREEELRNRLLSALEGSVQ